jgi:integrase
MTGHIRRRGARSWEIKFDLGTDPTSGRRQTRYHSFKGTRREAEAELVRLKAQAQRGDYIDQSKMTVEQFIEQWQADWARGNTSAKTFESYTQLLSRHVIPRLGSKLLQKVRPADLAALYAELAKTGRALRSKKSVPSGLSPRSISLIHRILHRAFGHAVRWGLVSSNPLTAVDPPRAEQTEIEILNEQQVRDVLAKLRGRNIYPIAALGLATGMRRGELLALRWRDVKLEIGRLQVQQSLEQTKAGLRFKAPKTRAGRRTIALPSSIVTELRSQKAKQAELRLALGLGKADDHALVFQNLDAGPLNPNSVSSEWRRLVKSLKLPKVSLHAWRHTHASQLIAAGVDVLTVSRRLGHGSPAVTLNVYGHLFSGTDDRAAAIFDGAYSGVLTDQAQK